MAVGSEPRARRVDASSGPSLFRSVAFPVGAALALNAIVFALDLEGGGSRGPSADAPSGTPSGPLIGTIWIVLLAAIGVARWRLSRTMSSDARQAEVWVTFLVAGCLAYPLYTGGFRDARLLVVGAFLTLGLAAATTFVAFRAARAAGWLIVPTLLWSAYALLLLI